MREERLQPVYFPSRLVEATGGLLSALVHPVALASHCSHLTLDAGLDRIPSLRFDPHLTAHRGYLAFQRCDVPAERGDITLRRRKGAERALMSAFLDTPRHQQNQRDGGNEAEVDQSGAHRVARAEDGAG